MGDSRPVTSMRPLISMPRPLPSTLLFRRNPFQEWKGRWLLGSTARSPEVPNLSRIMRRSTVLGRSKQGQHYLGNPTCLAASGLHPRRRKVNFHFRERQNHGVAGTTLVGDPRCPSFNPSSVRIPFRKIRPTSMHFHIFSEKRVGQNY